MPQGPYNAFNQVGRAGLPKKPQPPQGTAGNTVNGMTWDGSQWSKGGQGSPYTVPFSMPKSTFEYEQNILTNPEYINKAGENPLGLNAALIYSLLGQREANEASEKDFKNAEGILYRNRDYTRSLLEGAGKTALEDEEMATKSERGGLDQDLINRGLTSTTVKDSLGAGITKRSGRRREEIGRNTAQAQVGNENLYAQLLSGLHGQRQRIFSPNVYSQLAGAASTPTGPGKTASVMNLFGQLGGSAIGALLG